MSSELIQHDFSTLDHTLSDIGFFNSNKALDWGIAASVLIKAGKPSHLGPGTGHLQSRNDHSTLAKAVSGLSYSTGSGSGSGSGIRNIKCSVCSGWMLPISGCRDQ